MPESAVSFADMLAERVRQEGMSCLAAGAWEAGACLFTLADRVDEPCGDNYALVALVHEFADRHASLLWENEAGQFQSVPAVTETCLEDAVQMFLNRDGVAA